MMTKRVSFSLAIVLALAAGADAQLPPPPATPFNQDPMGPISDVTDDYTNYQPADAFCIKPDVPIQFPTDNGATLDGTDPDCASSGFTATDTGLYKVTVVAPPLCPSCRRIFIDYSKIPHSSDPPIYYAYGHVYFHLYSFNPTYTVDPKGHSPNIKNFTNDKLFVPDGSAQEPVVGDFDTHAIAYTGETLHFAHVTQQGPWYVGPWYVNRHGERINGSYLDVDLGQSVDLGSAALNAIYYMAGFRSDDGTCPDDVLFNGAYADGNYFYGGCADHGGSSSSGVNPFP